MEDRDIAKRTADIFELECIKNLNDEQHEEFAKKIRNLILCFEIFDAEIEVAPWKDASLLSSKRISKFLDTFYGQLREVSRMKELHQVRFCKH